MGQVIQELLLQIDLGPRRIFKVTIWDRLSIKCYCKLIVGIKEGRSEIR